MRNKAVTAGLTNPRRESGVKVSTYCLVPISCGVRRNRTETKEMNGETDEKGCLRQALSDTVFHKSCATHCYQEDKTFIRLTIVGYGSNDWTRLQCQEGGSAGLVGYLACPILGRSDFLWGHRKHRI